MKLACVFSLSAFFSLTALVSTAHAESLSCQTRLSTMLYDTELNRVQTVAQFKGQASAQGSGAIFVTSQVAFVGSVDEKDGVFMRVLTNSGALTDLNIFAGDCINFPRTNPR